MHRWSRRVTCSCRRGYIKVRKGGKSYCKCMHALVYHPKRRELLHCSHLLSQQRRMWKPCAVQRPQKERSSNLHVPQGLYKRQKGRKAALQTYVCLMHPRRVQSFCGHCRKVPSQQRRMWTICPLHRGENERSSNLQLS